MAECDKLGEDRYIGGLMCTGVFAQLSIEVDRRQLYCAYMDGWIGKEARVGPVAIIGSAC